MVDNPATRVGEIIERISRHCGTRWVLRIDDDELPSLQMLAFVNSVIAGDSCRAVSFERHQCVVNRSGAMLRNTRHSPVVHRQWRLYQPDAVEFHARGHTRCFELDPLSELAAPSEAHMIHLDWVFHSREERVQKIARYDAHTPNHGTMFKDYYLGDTSPTFLDELTPLPAEEFVAVGRKMAARFPKSAVQADAPRPAARESA
jgi:hypothetical protein